MEKSTCRFCCVCELDGADSICAGGGAGVHKGEISQPAENSQRVKFSSECGLVTDVGTQHFYYEKKNGEELHYPASITKLLTALVVMERCELDETVIFSRTMRFMKWSRVAETIKDLKQETSLRWKTVSMQ